MIKTSINKNSNKVNSGNKNSICNCNNSVKTSDGNHKNYLNNENDWKIKNNKMIKEIIIAKIRKKINVHLKDKS